MHKEAGRPWPVLSEDPVVDYMVMEAVHIKAMAEQEEAQKQAKKKEWKKDFSSLDAHR